MKRVVSVAEKAKFMANVKRQVKIGFNQIKFDQVSIEIREFLSAGEVGLEEAKAFSERMATEVAIPMARRLNRSVELAYDNDLVDETKEVIIKTLTHLIVDAFDIKQFAQITELVVGLLKKDGFVELKLI